MVANTDTPFPSMKTNLPPNLLRPIEFWSKEDVQKWIEYCIEEYALGEINSNDFGMNGKALSLLDEDGFKQRASRSGDILYKALQQHSALLKSLSCQTISQQLWNSFGLLSPAWMRHLNMPFPPLLPPAMPYVHSALNYMYNCPESAFPTSLVDATRPVRSRQTSNSSTSSAPKPLEKIEQHRPPSSSTAKGEEVDVEHDEIRSIPSRSHELTAPKVSPVEYPRIEQQQQQQQPPSDGQDNSRQIRYYNDRIDFHGDILLKPKAAKNCRILWEFLYILLEDPLYESIIHWENREKMIFRINQADKLAALWGLQKNRLSMTYEKLSRGMRYYYSNNIISKEQSKRLLYRFMRSPEEIRKNMKRHVASAPITYPVVTKNPLLSESNTEPSAPSIPPPFLQMFSSHPALIASFNPAANLLLPARDKPISNSDRASSSSPESFASSHESEKRYSSSSQSYSSTTKRKQAIPMQLATRLRHSYPFEQPLDLAAGKPTDSAMN